MARPKVTPEHARQYLRESIKYNKRRKLEEDLKRATEECRRAFERDSKEMEKYWAHPPRKGALKDEDHY